MAQLRTALKVTCVQDGSPLVGFFQTRLVDHRSLVGGIGSSLGSASKAMKIKCETAQPPPWTSTSTPSRTTISARLNKLNSPLYSPLHVFVAQVQQVLRRNILQFQISGGKKSALEPGGAHVTSDLTLPPIKVGINKVYLQCDFISFVDEYMISDYI